MKIRGYDKYLAKPKIRRIMFDAWFHKWEKGFIAKLLKNPK